MMSTTQLELWDPLMMTLIENPIKLPTSDLFMDKSVIINIYYQMKLIHLQIKINT